MDHAREMSESLRERALRAYHRGDPDAAGRVAAALAAQPLNGGLLIADATLAQEARAPGATDRLQAVLATAPDWLDGHSALAELRWGAGDHEGHLDALVRALDQLPRHAGLWMRYMTLLADGGAPLRAADVAARLRRTGPDVAALRLIEARYAGTGGAHARAERLLQTLPKDMPEYALEAARQRLRANDPAASIALLDQARTQSPDDMVAWALTELAWRAVEDPRHGWLIGPGSIAALQAVTDETCLAELADCLHSLHRHRWPPLGQSIRGGTQTRGNLMLRDDPPLKRLWGQLDVALTPCLAAWAAYDPEHPVRKHRPQNLEMATAWSIRIDQGGHHVSHVHPSGVLSSAFHIVVPARSSDIAQEGWLELGRPPADLGLQLDPLTGFAPRPGQLVLFPSFLYHGTRPFGDGTRMSVAFDVR